MNTQRRTLLKGTLASGAIAVAVGAGLMTPRTVLAAWPKGAFEAKSVSDALKDLTGSDSISESGDIKIKAPDIAENGAVVPVTVESSLENVESVSILAAKNNTPLTSNYTLAENTQPYIATRIKMGKTADVVAVVKSGDKLYTAKKEVKVTIGGCGG